MGFEYSQDVNELVDTLKKAANDAVDEAPGLADKFIEKVEKAQKYVAISTVIAAATTSTLNLLSTAMNEAVHNNGFKNVVRLAHVRFTQAVANVVLSYAHIIEAGGELTEIQEAIVETVHDWKLVQFVLNEKKEDVNEDLPF